MSWSLSAFRYWKILRSTRAVSAICIKYSPSWLGTTQNQCLTTSKHTQSNCNYSLTTSATAQWGLWWVSCWPARIDLTAIGTRSWRWKWWRCWLRRYSRESKNGTPLKASYCWLRISSIVLNTQIINILKISKGLPIGLLTTMSCNDYLIFSWTVKSPPFTALLSS